MLNCIKWLFVDENNLNDVYKEWEKRCIYIIWGLLIFGVFVIIGS